MDVWPAHKALPRGQKRGISASGVNQAERPAVFNRPRDRGRHTLCFPVVPGDSETALTQPTQPSRGHTTPSGRRSDLTGAGARRSKARPKSKTRAKVVSAGERWR